MASPRSQKIAIGFMVVWLIFWMGGMLVVIYGLGSAALGGELGASLMILAWLAAAGLGLYLGAKRLKQLLTGDEAPPRAPGRNHEWDDRVATSEAHSPVDRSDLPPPLPKGQRLDRIPTVRRRPRS